MTVRAIAFRMIFRDMLYRYLSAKFVGARIIFGSSSAGALKIIHNFLNHVIGIKANSTMAVIPFMNQNCNPPLKHQRQKRLENIETCGAQILRIVQRMHDKYGNEHNQSH